MRRALFLTAGVLALAGAFFQAAPTLAAFHCMRIHAVMAGFNGNNNVQYVELRMTTGGQSFIANHPLKFYDANGVLKATFNVPDVNGPGMPDVSNSATGESILIGTMEFNNVSVGGNADFVFAGNTVASNGGDASHPIQTPAGKVTFAEGQANCTPGGPLVVDSVTYGAYTPPASASPGTMPGIDFPSPATALPNPGDSRVLRLSNLNTDPSSNSGEYTPLQTVSITSGPAATPISSNYTTPRNNARTVLGMPASQPAVGGVGGVWIEDEPPPQATSAGSDSTPYVGAGAGAGALVLLAGGAWYVWRRRARSQAP